MINIQSECLKRFEKELEYLGNNKQVNSIEPLVSVTVATYQHKDFIRTCLDGILMQKTNFPFEVIVGEDESKDGTREICMEYAEKFPDKIRLFLRDRNTSQLYDENGLFVCRFNGIWNRMSVRGKYIAWCEGDDYWTDPHKLQKQVDFMETHPQYSLCFHNAIFQDLSNGCQYPFTKSQKKVYYTRDVILSKWFCPTASILVRTCAVRDLPKDARRIVNGDLLLLFVSSLHGPLYYMNEIMSVYNYGVPGSISLNYGTKYKTLLYKNKLYFLTYINRLTSNKYILYVGAKQIYTILAMVKHILESTTKNLLQRQTLKVAKIHQG